jgi:hypothetical protein
MKLSKFIQVIFSSVGQLMLLLLGCSALAAAPVSPPRVLMMAETVFGGNSSLEAAAVQLALPGCALDIVSATNWPAIPATGLGGPTGYGFDSYRAIIIGDPKGQTYNAIYPFAMAVLNSTKTNWTPACTGNIFLAGVDNSLHAVNGYNNSGALKTLQRGIAFAVNDPNKTGFYYALSSYYGSVVPATPPVAVPHLSGFGTFMDWDYNWAGFDNCHLVATHPILTNPPAMTDADISGWGASTHSGFTVWPPNFVVLAIALTNGAYTATDGSSGIPYMLVRGEGVQVLSAITLAPPLATNNLGTAHTVCATLSTNVSPLLGVPVTFSITSGPNAPTNATILTDSNGVACFTYTGLGGAGIDYITASFTNGPLAQTSPTVAKIWAETCLKVGCETVECLPDATWSYTFCVTNLTASPLTSITLQNPPAGITFSTNVIFLPGSLNPGQSTLLTVNITSLAGATNFCFQTGAVPESPSVPPCSTLRCLTLPPCCNRVISNQLTFASSSGTTNIYNYQLTLQNISGSPIKFVGLAAEQSCVTFSPPMMNLTLPAFGGPSLLYPSQSRTLNLQVLKTAPCPGSNTVHLSTFTTNLLACCSTQLRLPAAKCVFLAWPYDLTYYPTNTPIALRAVGPPATVSPCPFGMVLFYQGQSLVGVADREPYETTFLPPGPGTYTFTAVALLSTGEAETSDPAQVIVVVPHADTNHTP